MIDRTHTLLSVVAQCQLLALPRSSFYYRPTPLPEEDLKLMRRLDELHLAHPFAGSRMLRLFLQREGFQVGRRRVVRLMRQAGLEALYRKPGTTHKDPGHTVYPYLLRDLTVSRSNQAWAADMGYVQDTCKKLSQGIRTRWVCLTMVRTVFGFGLADGKYIGAWNLLKNQSFKHL